MISCLEKLDLPKSDLQKSELQKLVLLPVAMILFLCAASTSPGLTWRGSAPVQIVAAR